MLDEGKEIVQVNESKDTTPRQEMDLETARGILQDLVGTQENSITETSPLDQIGGHSVDQIREATRLIGEDLIKDAEAGFGFTFLRKQTPQGYVSLGVWQGSDQEHNPTGQTEKFTLSLSEGANDVLVNSFPVTEPTDDIRRITTVFKDHRINRAVSLDNLAKEFKLDDYRFMIRALRWMSANVLDWKNPQCIMPEQLDNLSSASPLK